MVSVLCPPLLPPQRQAPLGRGRGQCGWPGVGEFISTGLLHLHDGGGYPNTIRGKKEDRYSTVQYRPHYSHRYSRHMCMSSKMMRSVRQGAYGRVPLHHHHPTQPNPTCTSVAAAAATGSSPIQFQLLTFKTSISQGKSDMGLLSSSLRER